MTRVDDQQVAVAAPFDREHQRQAPCLKGNFMPAAKRQFKQQTLFCCQCRQHVFRLVLTQHQIACVRPSLLLHAAGHQHLVGFMNRKTGIQQFLVFFVKRRVAYLKMMIIIYLEALLIFVSFEKFSQIFHDIRTAARHIRPDFKMQADDSFFRIKRQCLHTLHNHIQL